MYDEYTDALGPAPAMAAGEYILWRGKPKRSAYIADKALALLPIAVIWAVFDFQFVRAAMYQGDPMLLIFLLVHLFPVWLWLGSAVTGSIQWRNEEYCLTNKRVIISRGVFRPARQSVFLRDIYSVRLHYGLLDRVFGSGDIYLNYQRTRHGSSGWYLLNLAEPEKLHERIELLVLEAGGLSQDEIHY